MSVQRGWSESPVKSLQLMFELAQKALAIDDSHDGAHTLLAAYYNMKRQFDKGLAEVKKAVVLNPNSSMMNAPSMESLSPEWAVLGLILWTLTLLGLALFIFQRQDLTE